MKYTGINIGPILSTISMGRKPREIWAASYMFSFLMECIIKEIKKKGGVIVSPAIVEKEENSSTKKEENKHEGVGLYPDRVFFQGDFEASDVVKEALKEFKKTTEVDESYVNVMHVTVDGKDSAEDKEIIKHLNQLLDCTELCNRPVQSMSRDKVLTLIRKKKNSKLFEHAHNDKDFPIPYLAEIATKRLEKLNQDKWSKLRDDYQGKDSNINRRTKDSPSSKLRDDYQGKDSNNDGDEDAFYQDLKDKFKETYGEDFFSFYKYICIVQADGDNMGKIVSSITADKVQKVSESLLNYGKEACNKIRTYGGFPIYAGGDDLLFIAPVKGNGQTMFGLIDDIDKLYANIVDKSIDGFRPDSLHTYLSYGLSISYYKYPLYEAFKDARDQLFGKAKEVDGKNAVSWCLRKHSGSGFIGSLTKNGDIYVTFKQVMNSFVEEKAISAIAHKLKNNENLLSILLDNYRKEGDKRAFNNRLKQFYQKTMEDTASSQYITLSRRLLRKLMIKADHKIGMDKILENMYGMLRTAKFINGEGDSDE